MIRIYSPRFAHRFKVCASDILMTFRGSKNLMFLLYIQCFLMFSCLVKEHSAYALSNVNSVEALHNSIPT